MKSYINTLIIPLLLLAAACTRPTAQQVKNDINSSLESNEKAKTISEWESSEHNSTSIFKRWKDTKADPEDVCNELLEKTPKELALFEEEIKDPDFKELLEPCKSELQKKLENYWKIEKAKISTTAHIVPLDSTSSFKFPDNIQTRDVSHGYKAYTGDVKNKEVLLTFDDGPHGQYTDTILSALAEVNAKALFFTVGKNVKANPEVLKRVAAAGHSIGSHSIDHKCLASKSICAKSNDGHVLSYEDAIAEITGGHQAVYNAIGWVDPFFRFPYGESSPELKEFLADRGVGEFYWSIDSEDWKNRTPAEMISFTMKQLEERQRGIILFHDIQRKTAEALPTLLKDLYFKGYSIVLLKSANPNDRYNSKLVIKKGT